MKPGDSRLVVVVIVVCTLVLMGCRSNRQVRFASPVTSGVASPVEFASHTIESPDVERPHHRHEFALPPLTSADQLPPGMDISVDEALQMGLNNSAILRTLGAQLLESPQLANGVYDPAINATDPVFGIEAALAQFDATLSASLNHANNDDVFNNSILGGGATEVVQDLSIADVALQKTAATGTRYTLRSNVMYDGNNNPTSTFPSSYSSFLEAQARQPLLQGNGIEFNRIAGPNAQPGFRNSSGLLISRINNDISIAKFELGVREYVDEVIQVYWDLYFAYRSFETAKLARDTALETWNTVKARFDNDLPGGEADKEAQAREQYYLFQQEVVAALNGDARAGVVGVLQAEANLRRLIGLPQNDGHLLRPSEEPMTAKTVFDWQSLVHQSLDSRVEIRQQLWRVKRRELELLASRNFMLPRLDAVATFRNNGFGDDLTGQGGRFSSALNDMRSGDHNEWEMGLQLNVPIGYRQASAGVRNSELLLYRERAILDEQEKLIIHDLGTAVRQTEQYHNAVSLVYNRMQAAEDTTEAREVAFKADAVALDLLLEGQRRLAQAQRAYYRAQVDLQLANESVRRESGQLLASHAIDVGPSQLNSSCRDRISASGTMDYRIR